MTTILARILYDEIRSLDQHSGLYLWCDPDEHGVLEVQHLLMGAPFKVENSTEYHVTLLYHKGELPHKIKIPLDRPMKGRPLKFDLWETPKGNVLVLLFDSQDMQSLHKELIGEGLTHSFDEFKPHLTVAKNVDLGTRERSWIDSRNHYLEMCPQEITFDSCIKASSLA